jgi:hypothetical protein
LKDELKSSSKISAYIKNEFLEKANGTFKWMEDNPDGCKDDYLAKKQDLEHSGDVFVLF